MEKYTTGNEAIEWAEMERYAPATRREQIAFQKMLGGMSNTTLKNLETLDKVEFFREVGDGR